VALLALPAAAPPPAMAQPARKEAPPALVAVTAIKSGVMAPQTELLGTVFFAEVSDVAAEVAGIVSAVRVEDGQRIDAGQPLVALGTELKAKRLEAARAAHQQALAEREVARIDLERREALFRKNSISAQSYDDNRFKVKALERRAGALQAEAERVALEIAKALIRAPFGGVVVRRSVDRGEWIAKGKTVAVVARDDVVDVVIEVPESIVRRIRTGQKVRVRVGDVTRDGVVEAVVPRGDVATRTFPVKVRCENRHSWFEGMSAAVALPYIRGAIDLVVQNILIGSVLAVTVLLLFLRRLASTLVVTAAIPISVVGTFLFMDLLGRSLNVVSLAGIAFAAGMLVDNAIVVLENIDRHRSMGKTGFAAAQDGAQEVWGAVLASTTTTVAVFLPVVFMREEAGQLFRDIAIAITCAITLSMIVSILVIPMLSRLLFRLIAEERSQGRVKRSIGRAGSAAAAGLMAALFENFLYPLIIMFTVPLAAAGGLLGLKLVNLFLADQPLDILTMLGFVILVGVVVNNAILIVYQALNNIRFYGMDHRRAVLESARTRLRPIFMSALTSLFAMLPLVLVPGPGSEFYRGLGRVVLGGLTVSTIFTIFVIPALLLMVIGREKPRAPAG
jgi:RND family efflux transporter MFP subunit